MPAVKPFGDRLVTAIRRQRSCVCVGLDPRDEWLPPAFEPSLVGIQEFLFHVVQIVRDHAVAVKPQIAFFERLGPAGIELYQATCEHAQEEGLLVIGDVKRGDVPETARAYAEAHTRVFPCDAITVNPFFGTDGIEPFLQAAEEHGTGLFVLVKTSNPSSAEIQNLEVGGRPLYLLLAEKTKEWGARLKGESGYSSVGAVVGATHPAEAEAIRAALPHTFFLVPGYGAQGGSAADIRGCFEEGGLGAIVNASRSITYAFMRRPYSERYGPSEWERAVEEAVIAMKSDLNASSETGLRGRDPRI